MCTHTAETYPKNYYCWTHRLDVIKINFKYYKSRSEYLKVVVKSELKWLTNTWLRQHVSDHSAAHYGGEVIRLYTSCFTNHFNEDETLWCLSFLSNILWCDGEFSCHSYVERFPSNEVVWIWRRICSRLLLDLISYSIQNDLLTKECTAALDDFLENEFATISNRLQSNFFVEDRAEYFAKKYIAWNLYQLKKYYNMLNERYPNIREHLNLSAAVIDDDICRHLM